MNKVFAFFAAVFAVIIFSGCADPVVFSEVFQLKKGEKIYTRYNIWYTDPEDISCLNIQQGAFIPLGTEIEPVSTSAFGSSISFRDAAGKKFTIKFSEGYRLCSMQDYIAYTFGTKTQKELLAEVPEAVRSRILRGEVVPGMTREQVLLSYGPPPAIRTADMKNESWIYWITPSAAIRLIWRGDKVSNVLNINK